MSLVALKFVFAALIVMILVGVMWLAAELRYAPPAVQRLAGWILGVVLALGLVALLAPIAGAMLWWSFG